MGLKENIASVKKRIAKAVQKSGRTTEEVKLVVVSKKRSLKQIREVKKFGQKDFGESRIQELLEKAGQLQGVTWHFVGTLQRNKVRDAVKVCEFIHSVDSTKLLKKINQKANELNKIQKVFLQINVSGEKTKHGFKTQDIKIVLEMAKNLKNVKVVGLMTMAPLAEAEQTRTIFRTLKMLAQTAELKELSMGMSNDFEVAVEEGATFVRIGTAVF